MKIKHLNRNQIDVEKWNNCIENAIEPLIYCYSWFLDIIAVEWEALVLDDYNAVFPLTKNKKFGINYLYTPVYIQKIKISSPIILSEEEYKLFFNSIPKKYYVIDINIEISKNNIPKDFQIFTLDNYELNLIKPFAEMQSNFRRNTKRNIAKAVENKIIVKEETVFDDFIKVRKSRAFGRANSKLKEEHFTRLSNLNSYCLENEKAKIYNAYNELGEFCSSCIFFFNKNKIIISHISTEQGFEANANYLIFDTFIRNHAEQNLILDFSGSNIKGIAYFNEGFGSVKTEYFRIYRNKMQGIYNFVKKFKK